MTYILVPGLFAGMIIAIVVGILMIEHAYTTMHDLTGRKNFQVIIDDVNTFPQRYIFVNEPAPGIFRQGIEIRENGFVTFTGQRIELSIYQRFVLRRTMKRFMKIWNRQMGEVPEDAPRTAKTGKTQIQVG